MSSNNEKYKNIIDNANDKEPDKAFENTCCIDIQVDVSEHIEKFEVLSENSDSSITNSPSLSKKTLKIHIYLDFEGKNYKYIDDSCDKKFDGRVNRFYSKALKKNIKGIYKVTSLLKIDYARLLNVYFWISPYGIANIKKGSVGYGLLKINKNGDVISGESNKKSHVVYNIKLIKSPLVFLVDEINSNISDPIVKDLKVKNRKARAIYDRYQGEWAYAIHRRYSLSQLSPEEKNKALIDILGSTIKGEHNETFFNRLGYATNGGVGEAGIYIATGLGKENAEDLYKLFNHFNGKKIADFYAAFYEIKHPSLAKWAKKVHKDTGDLASKLQNLYFLGGGEWDYKRDIGAVWNVWNRLGNDKIYEGGHAIFYDIWANINYGFMGYTCGFSLEELTWGAGGAQVVDTGTSGGTTKDDTADIEATVEGYNLAKIKTKDISIEDIMGIIEKYNSLSPTSIRIKNSWISLPDLNNPKSKTYNGNVIHKRC